MRRSVALICAFLVAAPALAETSGGNGDAAAKPKMKKVCHADVSGNPLFPTMRCHSVPVETATVEEPGKPANTQVALAKEPAPR